MRRPVVVSCTRRERAVPYVAALAAAGVPAESVRVVDVADSGQRLGQLAADAAGLLLCGGPDVHPQRYGEAPRPDAGLEIVAERDELEWRLLAGAERARTPVFAVCRGMQVVNVYLGGTLYQDLPSDLGLAGHDLPGPLDGLAHAIRVDQPATAAGALFAAGSAWVNSRHHQAVKRLADRLRPVATAPDGVLEVTQVDDPDWWVWGVQWHPENLLGLAVQCELWRRFASATGHRPAAANGAVTAVPQ